MKNRIFSLVAIAAVVTLGACKKDGDAGGDSTTKSDTTTQVVTQQDTQAVVTSTTTTVDTAKVDSTGKAAGAAMDTTKKDTAHKM